MHIFMIHDSYISGQLQQVSNQYKSGIIIYNCHYCTCVFFLALKVQILLDQQSLIKHYIAFFDKWKWQSLISV